MQTRFHRPDPSEYNTYYHRYVSAVPDVEIRSFLPEQASVVASRMGAVPVVRETYRYEPGKWSVREVLGHLADTERIFAYRLLTFARAQDSVLPGMDPDVFMAGSRFAERPLHSIADEFASVRAATSTLVDSLTEADADRAGMASGFPFTVRAILFIIAGHVEHHLHILRDRYGV